MCGARKSKASNPRARHRSWYGQLRTQTFKLAQIHLSAESHIDRLASRVANRHEEGRGGHHHGCHASGSGVIDKHAQTHLALEDVPCLEVWRDHPALMSRSSPALAPTSLRQFGVLSSDSAGCYRLHPSLVDGLQNVQRQTRKECLRDGEGAWRQLHVGVGATRLGCPAMKVWPRRTETCDRAASRRRHCRRPCPR